MAPLLLDLRTPYFYMELKQCLLDMYRLSEDERACSFSNITELSDCKPSEVMDQMDLMHRQEPPTFLLCYAFKNLLPPPVHHALSAFPSANPRAWAKEADWLMVNHEEQYLHLIFHFDKS